MFEIGDEVVNTDYETVVGIVEEIIDDEQFRIRFTQHLVQSSIGCLERRKFKFYRLITPKEPSLPFNTDLVKKLYNREG